MVKEKIVESTILIYEELYQQCTLQKNFVMLLRENEYKWLNTFADFIVKQYREEEISTDLLIRYFEFQFSRYVGIEPPKSKRTHGRNTILLQWVIGKKAIEAWKSRDLKKNWLIKLKLREEFTLQLNKAFKKENKAKQASGTLRLLNAVNQLEEQTKLKFYNLPEGLVWCGTVNTVFNPCSEVCAGCINKTPCMEILQQNYPKLFKIRMKIWQEMKNN